MHGMGVGMARDERAMVRLLTRAADLGLANAQAQLGMSYQRGLGVTRDLDKSHVLLLQAARAGHKGAMRELATVYEMGLGVPADDAEAKRWRERAQ